MTTAAAFSIRERVSSFGDTLPFKQSPFVSRAWGHPLHSLCSYQGKLKPSIAHWLVREFTTRGESVLDPLGGVGTVAFEAACLGRRALSNDKSPFAATVASGKLDPPTLSEVESLVDRLRARMLEVELSDADYEAAEFGLNGRVSDYYHPDTLDEVLRARRLFASDSDRSCADNFIWACLLHILHGNRPYAISRISHPITPFHPSGPYEYKPLADKLLDRARRALHVPLPDAFQSGRSLEGDYAEVPGRVDWKADAIITSPPFLGMRFDRPNWLRLWFCGWGENDFHTRSLTFLERQQTRSRECYKEFFGACADLLRPAGLLILHLGSGKDDRLLTDLMRLADARFALVGRASEDVAGLEQHGIRDKGLTGTHHFLFFQPR